MCARFKIVLSHIGDGMGANEIGKSRHPQKLGVGLGGVDKDARDNGGGGKPLLFKTDPVVQTARRTPASITHPGNDDISVSM